MTWTDCNGRTGISYKWERWLEHLFRFTSQKLDAQIADSCNNADTTLHTDEASKLGAFATRDKSGKVQRKSYSTGNN